MTSIELPISRLAALEERDLEAVRDTLAGLGLPCRACNDFMPPAVPARGGGDRPRRRRWSDYLAGAFDRLERLGVPVALSSAAPWSRRLSGWSSPGPGPMIRLPRFCVELENWRLITECPWRWSIITELRLTC